MLKFCDKALTMCHIENAKVQNPFLKTVKVLLKFC